MWFYTDFPDANGISALLFKNNLSHLYTYLSFDENSKNISFSNILNDNRNNVKHTININCQLIKLWFAFLGKENRDIICNICILSETSENETL